MVDIYRGKKVFFFFLFTSRVERGFNKIKFTTNMGMAVF